MNRRMNTERRPAAAGFGPACSSVAGMALHHPEGRRAMQEASTSVLRGICDALPELLSGHSSSTLLWIAPAMSESAAKTIDRRPIATRNRKWAQAATAWLASRNVSPNITIACLYSLVVPRSWQIFHFDNLKVGVMALALTLIIAGCLVTVVRRRQRIARALK
jgi:hypothetical protein